MQKALTPATRNGRNVRVETPTPASRSASKVVTVFAALVLSYATFRDVDHGAALAQVRSLDAAACFLIVPSVLALFAEARAWQSAVTAFARRPSVLRLAHVRIVTESFGAMLPFGALWAEATKPHLLRRHCGFSFSDSLTAIAARKYLLILTQSAYVCFGFLLGYDALATASRTLTGSGVLLWLLPSAALLLVGLAEGMALWLRGGRALAQLLGPLARVPFEPLKRTIERGRQELERTDEHARKFFGTQRRFALGPVVMTLAGWMMEALETWLILSMLGQRLDFGSALVVEATVVFVRHLLCMLPAGLGAQELGYAALLGALGVSLEANAAFTLLKRGRELLWAATGYGLFVLDTARTGRAAARGLSPFTLVERAGR